MSLSVLPVRLQPSFRAAQPAPAPAAPVPAPTPAPAPQASSIPGNAVNINIYHPTAS